MAGKGKQLLKKTVLFTAGSLAASAAVNRVMTKKEKESIRPYGFKVETQYGGMNVAIAGEKGPVIVLLSGYGTAAPILDFKPLAQELSRFAKVITVEYLGYGCSDSTRRSRTLDRITEEIHEVLQRMNLYQYWLMPHSISGVYALAYVQRYPKEVQGVIGIDPSVPEQINYVDSSVENRIMKPLKKMGLLRLMDWMRPGTISPNTSAYDKEDLQQIRWRTLDDQSNPVWDEEARQIPENFRMACLLSYPKTMPVLYFLSSATCERTRGWWKELHEKQLSDLLNAELVVLEGPHYLHWENSTRIAQKSRQFILETLQRKLEKLQQS